MRRHRRDRKLIGPWRTLHGALWLIGLAILIWQGWMWPGILVLIALSAGLEALLVMLIPEAAEPVEPDTTPAPAAPPAPAVPPVREHRLELLPSECPKCGAPIRGEEVKWSGAQSADCPYCGANLPMKK